MTLKARHLIGAGLWGTAAYGLLYLGTLPGDFGHELCGVWGCFPPLQALGAMHGLWFLILTPLVVWAGVAWPVRRLQSAGLLLLALGLLGLGAVVTKEMLVWLPQQADEYRRYFPYRVGYSVATLSDVPLIQTTLAGAACWLIGRRKRKSNDRGPHLAR